jgi:hypothetical protein
MRVRENRTAGAFVFVKPCAIPDSEGAAPRLGTSAANGSIAPGLLADDVSARKPGRMERWHEPKIDYNGWQGNNLATTLKSPASKAAGS